MRDIPETPCFGLIKTFEGNAGQFEPTRAQDPVGNWEIGWSHKLTGDTDPLWSETLDAQAAHDLAISDLTVAAQGVCDALGDAVTGLTDGQYAALIDFTYNEGVDAFTNSTLCQLVINRAMHLVPAEFLKWKYETINGVKVVSNGLVNRRKAEISVWLK